MKNVEPRDCARRIRTFRLQVWGTGDEIDVTPKTHQNNWTKIHCLWVVQNFLSRADFCCDPVPQTNWVRAVRTT